MKITKSNLPVLRKLGRKERGAFRNSLLTMLAASPDPFVSVLYQLDMGPCKKLALEISRKTDIKITITHIVNKLIACAIAENPVYNQVVLDGHIYQMDAIRIANVLLLPGPDQALTNFVLTDPHLKPLVQVRNETKHLIKNKIREFENSKRNNNELLLSFFFKAQLYRLISEKFAFVLGVSKGLSSNVILSNHVYSSPANYLVLKPIITPVKVSLRIHTCGIVEQPVAVNGAVVIKEMMPIHVITDHRVIHGVHGHAFGDSLVKMAAAPEKYLV